MSGRRWRDFVDGVDLLTYRAAQTELPQTERPQRNVCFPLTAFPNGAVATYAYDSNGRLTNLTHKNAAGAVIQSFSYTYDPLGNRNAKSDGNGSYEYAYDALGRLIEATSPLPTNPLESFTYDPVGNRTTSNQNGPSIFNSANQLTEDANFTYQYDNNGNLTGKTAKIDGAITSYEYDAENKLIRVVNNGTVVNYKYDVLGRRIEKQINDGVTTKATRFVYDNEDILLELDANNNIVTRYTHGPGIDEPLIMDEAGQSYFYHADGLGSIIDITDQSGAVVQRYTYSSFGEIESQLDSNFIQPYMLTAREFDPETGFHYYRARYYDSFTGRFIQQDPIGFAGGDINLYRYVASNPVNGTDPSGLLFGGLVNAGECYGDYAAQYWADLANSTGNPLYYLLGGLASLWTPATSDNTFTILSIAAGSASLVKSVGTEWSHWIPARFGTARGGVISDAIINSPLNGNYRTILDHAINDPFRARFMGKEFIENQLNPAWLRQWNRLPDWIKGVGLGGAAQASKRGAGACACQ